jgi:hypothetical protein
MRPALSPGIAAIYAPENIAAMMHEQQFVPAELTWLPTRPGSSRMSEDYRATSYCNFAGRRSFQHYTVRSCARLVAVIRDPRPSFARS